MNHAASAIVASLVGMLLGTGLRPAVAIPQENVAIVCFLSGTGFVTVQGKRTELELFQRLHAGAAVEVAGDSKMVLAFFTGDRLEFGAMSSAILARTGLARTKGPIRELPRVPAIVDIAPIVKEEGPGGRMAGIRIRSTNASHQSIRNLDPSNGATVLAESAVVRFDPVPGYERYHVVIEDDRGDAVFSIDTVTTLVRVPPMALAAGRSYYWSVRTLDDGKPAIGADGLFWTLGGDHEKRRAAFKHHVDASDDAMLHGLLAEVDHSLGLGQQACEAIRRALDLDPANERMNGVLERFACVRK